MDSMVKDESANLLGKPLMGKPSCELRETSRYTKGSGATIIRYDGTDGCEYHCTIHTNGFRTWSGFGGALIPPERNSAR